MTYFAPAIATVIFVYIYYVWMMKENVNQKRFLLSLALAVFVVTAIGYWIEF